MINPNIFVAAAVVVVLTGVAVHGAYWARKHGLRKNKDLEVDGSDPGARSLAELTVAEQTNA